MGNPLTLRRNPDFAFILDECKKHGTFLRKKKTRKFKTNLKTKTASLTNISTLQLANKLTTTINN